MVNGIIEEKRIQIRKILFEQSNNIKNGAIEVLSTRDLELLFNLYDLYFLDHWFKNNYTQTMKFSLSKRMIRSAGMTLYQKKKKEPAQGQLEIRISADFLFNFEEGQRAKSVGGLSPKDSLGALMLIFEHELCHAYEFVLSGKSSCKQKPFKDLIFTIFGQTQSTHGLPTVREIASDVMGIHVGGRYTFLFKAQQFTGHLIAIHKRGVIMVLDSKGRYSDAKGSRYSKYYVGLHQLKPLKE